VFQNEIPRPFCLRLFLVIFSGVLCKIFIFNDIGSYTSSSYFIGANKAVILVSLLTPYIVPPTLTWESTSCALRTWFQEGYFPATSSLLREKPSLCMCSFGINLLTASVSSLSIYLARSIKTFSQNTKRDAYIGSVENYAYMKLLVA
jgi:hypothetical protein